MSVNSVIGVYMIITFLKLSEERFYPLSYPSPVLCVLRHPNLFILGTQCGYGGKFDVGQFFIKVTSVTRNTTLSV